MHLGDAALTGGILAISLGLIEVVKTLIARRNGRDEIRSSREAIGRVEHTQEKIVEAIVHIAADQRRTADALDRMESRWPV